MSTLKSSTENASSIEIQPYDKGRAGEIVDLMNLALGRSDKVRRDVPYWRWKHDRNPFGESIVLLAECEGTLVGMRSFMRWRLQANGRVISAAKPVDTVTHPDYQRRGIFRNLTNAACELAEADGVELLFNTPNDNSRPGYVKLGWTVAGVLPMLILPLRPLSGMAQLVAARFGNNGPTKTIDEADFFTDEPQSAETAIECLSGRAEPVATWPDEAGRLSTARSTEFLNWRYTQHPHFRYYAVSTRSQDAWLLFRLNSRQGLREVIVDDLFLDTSGDLKTSISKIRELLKALRQSTRAHYAVCHAAIGTQIAAAMRGSGFRKLPLPGKLYLAARALHSDADLPDPTQLGHWSLRLGDLEGL